MVAQSSDAELVQNEDLFDTNEVKDQSSMDASEDEEENFPPSEDKSNDEENFKWRWRQPTARWGWINVENIFFGN